MRVLITKHDRTLKLYDGEDLLRTIPVALGKNPADKEREGDRATPEGEFYVCYRNPDSRYHRFLGISYPNTEDAARGRSNGMINEDEFEQIRAAITRLDCPPWKTALGGEVGLHGPCPNVTWTHGCVAMEINEIEQLYDQLQLGDKVVIRPMTPSDFAWLLVMLAAFDVSMLFRRGIRWHGVQLAQAIVTGIAGGLAIAEFQPVICLAVGAAVYTWCRILPALGLMASHRYREQGRWRSAADWRRRAGLMLGGHYWRWYGQLADSMNLVARGKGDGADKILEALATGKVPRQVGAQARLLQLEFNLHRRQWERAVEMFEQVTDWGPAVTMTEAHLLVARAYAECGQFNAALHCVEVVLVSPIAGRFTRQIWLTRVRLAAMAGHPAEVKRLLAERESQRVAHRRFAVYWRGRCALARGDHAPAVKLLSRAYALTDQRDFSWQDAIGHYLHLAEQEPTEPATPAADSPGYATRFEAVCQAEEMSAEWRQLFAFNWRHPVTLILVAGLATIAVLAFLVPASTRIGWENRFGNLPWPQLAGQWWRPLTAMFFHDGIWHLLTNLAGLLMFGGVVGRVMGWWRYLVVFLAGGYCANLASAGFGNFDLAIGASSGVYALLGACAVLVYAIRNPFYDRARRRALALLALVVVVDFLVTTQAVRIDYMAHLGGFLSGIVITAALWLPRQKLGRQENQDYSPAT